MSGSASIIIMGLCLLCSAAQACSVPVFRYALERWPADPHLLERAEPQADIDFATSHCNLWPSAGESGARISFPDGGATWYEGAWSPSVAQAAVDSPLRRRLSAELIGGTTAVFLFIGNKDVEKSQAELTRIRATLMRLQSEVQLPEEDPIYDAADPSSQLGTEVPLQLLFGLNELQADAPGEAMFRRQLLALDPQYDASKGPLLVAVYGRGRAFSLYEDGLGDDVLTELAWFLCGACSCQVKALNPGIDLLLSIDWDEALWSYPKASQVQLPDGSSFALQPVAGSLQAPAQVVSSSADQAGAGLSWPLIAGLIVAAVLAVALLVLTLRLRRA